MDYRIPDLREPDCRKVYWRADRLVIMADGRPWALPAIDDVMLECCSGLTDSVRNLVALAHLNVVQTRDHHLVDPAFADHAALDLLRRVSVVNCSVLTLGVILLGENYSFPGDRDVLDLMPPVASPGWPDFQQAVFDCCGPLVCPVEELTESELSEADLLLRSAP